MRLKRCNTVFATSIFFIHSKPTSQTCSSCGFRGGKLDLSIRQWICLNCESTHDRDVNAAVNIKVAGGHSETQNGRGGKRQTIAKCATGEYPRGHFRAKVAASCEASTHQEFIQLSLFD
ncbi:MAG: zinc ribbon domain-containing protein [Nostoc sp.]|uniref:zinc ribbon domain-containing protein n=1 Tax=Nostoc sp. TaxID=1180 RepID=UPI002FFA8CD9